MAGDLLVFDRGGLRPAVDFGPEPACVEAGNALLAWGGASPELLPPDSFVLVETR